MVGDALVVAAEEGDVDGDLDAVRPAVVHHQAELVGAELVHLVVGGLEGGGGFDVAGLDHVTGGVDHGAGDGAHLLDDVVQLGGDGGGRVAQPGDLGDVRGQVAHPLEVGDHPERGDQHPQLVGDRGLAGHQLEDLLLDTFTGCVQLDVGRDDVLGLTNVGLQEGCGRPADGGGHGPGHPLELGEDVVELLVVTVTHCVRFRSVVCPFPGAGHAGTRSPVTVCRRGCRTATSGERLMNS
ncbi:hypothetical protein GCM10029976_049920 [Kribbella albertanoniae]